jgi:hypothetical protein
LDKEKINLRVYDESQDIYLGGYWNQQAMKLEKENIDEDFSNIQIKSFVGIANEGCLDKQLFLIAQVEQIVSKNKIRVSKVF